MKTQIMQTDFPKLFRRLLILAVIAVLLGGIASGIAFRTQITELIQYDRMAEQREDNEEAADTALTQESEKLHKHSEHEEHDFDELPITPPSTGSIVILAVFGLICIAAFAAYWLIIAAWIWQAAEKAGFHGLLWLLLALAGNLAAGVCFLLARSFLRKKCKDCGSWQNREHIYCVACGEPMNVVCASCGAVCSRDYSYCYHCGKSLK